jgi:hypothetical protein
MLSWTGSIPRPSPSRPLLLSRRLLAVLVWSAALLAGPAGCRGQPHDQVRSASRLRAGPFDDPLRRKLEALDREVATAIQADGGLPPSTDKWWPLDRVGTNAIFVLLHDLFFVREDRAPVYSATEYMVRDLATPDLTEMSPTSVALAGLGLTEIKELEEDRTPLPAWEVLGPQIKAQLPRALKAAQQNVKSVQARALSSADTDSIRALYWSHVWLDWCERDAETAAGRRQALGHILESLCQRYKDGTWASPEPKACVYLSLLLGRVQQGFYADVTRHLAAPARRQLSGSGPFDPELAFLCARHWAAIGGYRDDSHPYWFVVRIVDQRVMAGGKRLSPFGKLLLAWAGIERYRVNPPFPGGIKWLDRRQAN